MVDFESGEPIRLPAGVTDSQAAEAIKKAGAISTKDRFFGVKPDAASDPNAAAPAQQAPEQSRSPEAAAPRPQELIELRKRKAVLERVLKCLHA